MRNSLLPGKRISSGVKALPDQYGSISEHFLIYFRTAPAARARLRGVVGNIEGRTKFFPESG